MKHIHAEIIKAKAHDTSLLVFCRDTYHPDNGWVETSQWPIQEEFEYFLCQPQHHAVCLHWLNGGEVQTRRECSDLGWDTLLPFEGEWSKVSHFMCNDILLRIKPKKEKRWIALFSWVGGNTFVAPKPFDTREDLDEYMSEVYVAVTYQAIEIEVEA